VQHLEVGLKFVIPLLNYRIFSRGLFLLALPVCICKFVYLYMHFSHVYAYTVLYSMFQRICCRYIAMKSCHLLTLLLQTSLKPSMYYHLLVFLRFVTCRICLSNFVVSFLVSINQSINQKFYCS